MLKQSLSKMSTSDLVDVSAGAVFLCTSLYFMLASVPMLDITGHIYNSPGLVPLGVGGVVAVLCTTHLVITFRRVQGHDADSDAFNPGAGAGAEQDDVQSSPLRPEAPVVQKRTRRRFDPTVLRREWRMLALLGLLLVYIVALATSGLGYLTTTWLFLTASFLLLLESRIRLRLLTAPVMGFALSWGLSYLFTSVFYIPLP